MNELLIIEKAESFYNEVEITDKGTFSDGWLQNLGTV